MNGLLFWRRWRSPYRQLYAIGGAVFLLTALGTALAFFFPSVGAIGWEPVVVPESSRVLLPSFTHHLTRLQPEAISYLTSYRLEATAPDVPAWATGLWGLLTYGALVVLLAVVPALSRFWFLAALTLLLLLLFGLRLSILQLFDTTATGWIILFLAVLGGAAYAFHALVEWPFWRRLLAFAVLFAALAAFVGVGAGVPQPFLHLLHFGAVVPVALTLYFVLLVSFEIGQGIVYVVTDARLPGRVAILNLLLLHAIYFFLLIMLYYKGRRLDTFNFVYVDALFVLLLSGVLGLWGFRRREANYHEILPFVPLGAYAYLALGTVAFATLGYYVLAGNDPMLDMFRTAIVYAHLGFGASFMFYTLVNFGSVIAEGLKAHAVLFDPRYMPFAGVHAFGLMVIGALLLRADLYPYYLGQAGYYNGVGDVYRQTDDLFLAEQYYKQATRYTYGNFRAHYTLGALARAQQDRRLASLYFRRALEKNPPPQAYAALGQALTEEGRYFDALFAVQEGLSRHPGSDPLQFALGHAYANVSLPDSALAAWESADVTVAPTAALALRARLGYPPPSALRAGDYALQSSGYLGNATALSIDDPGWQMPFNDALLPDTLKRYPDFCYLMNQGLCALVEEDTTLLAPLARYAEGRAGPAYREDLDFLRAQLLYARGDRDTAFALLDRTWRRSVSSDDFYATQYGLWLLREGAYGRAATVLTNAAQGGYLPAFVPRALALSEAGQHRAAAAAWTEAYLTSDSADAYGVREQLDLVQAAAAQLAALPDSLLGRAVRYNRYRFGVDTLTQLAARVRDANYRTLANTALLERYRRYGQFPLGRALAAAAAPLAAEAIPELRVAFARERTLLLLSAADTNAAGEALRTLPDTALPGLRARLSLAAGDTTQAARYLRQARRSAPFDASWLIGQADLLRATGQPDAAYEWLVAARQRYPESPDVLMAYIRQALAFNLTEFAASARADLRTLLPPPAFDAFDAEYDRLVEVAQARLREF